MKKLSNPDLIELADSCFFTLGDRRQNCNNWRQFYYQGATDKIASINRIYGEINNLLSLIFSPEHIILEGTPVPFDESEEDPEQLILDQITDVVKDNFFGNRIDIALMNLLLFALIDGNRIIKAHYSQSSKSVKYIGIPADLFGVIYEGLAIDDAAQIFCEKTDLTEGQVRAYYPDIWKTLAQKQGEEHDETKLEESAGLKILLGGQGSKDAEIDVRKSFEFKPRSAKNTWEQRTLWQFEYQDNQWRRTVIVGDQVAKDELNGRTSHDYFNLKPIPIEGYFWGLSSVYLLHRIQEVRNKFLEDEDCGLDKSVELMQNPPLISSGYNLGWESGVDVKKKLRTPGEMVELNGQNAKVEPWLPKLGIEDAFRFIDFYDMQQKFILGVNEVMMGQSQKNVRSQGYANMLAQFASTQIKRIAHTVEAQLEELFTATGKLYQINDDKNYSRKEGDNPRSFKLGQYSRDYRIEIYAHTGSPITTENNINLSMTLAKMGILPARILVHILPMPFKAKILSWIKKMEQQKAQEKKEEIELAREGVIKLPAAKGAGGR